ncbi:hypothetical protein HPB52_008159 [Rhipicephalus sanguineus]|uniref:Sulfatase N-terminal domain-containing protein n=1 Tax=Rhipicephalus sanguineus TaxID=34632 RepID=A0A9D4SSB8_RHISA|nr:hypothetical protein HPB52_008159 [Rhipicephalus sanguineus]
MIDTLDESVGEVFETLGETGRLENTVVFFSSDNGGTPFGSHSSRSFNWPLRGTKLSVWEGSMRVPAFVWSPLLKRKRWVSNAPMHFIDLFTTVYSVADNVAVAIGTCIPDSMLHNLPSFLRIVSALMKRLDAYRAVTVPIENLPFDPASAPEYHNGTWAPWLD